MPLAYASFFWFSFGSEHPLSMDYHPYKLNSFSRTSHPFAYFLVTYSGGPGASGKLQFFVLILPVQNRRALSTHSDSQHIVATSVLSYPHTIRSRELPLRQDLLYHSVQFIFQSKFTPL